MLTCRGLGTVLGDLSEMGYDARWGVVSAADAGAPHKRERIWILCTDADGKRLERADVRKKRQWTANGLPPELGEDVSDSNSTGPQKDRAEQQTKRVVKYRAFTEWPIEPSVGRVAHGVAARVDRLKAIGNGQVPRVVALAWDILNVKPDQEGRI